MRMTRRLGDMNVVVDVLGTQVDEGSFLLFLPCFLVLSLCVPDARVPGRQS